MLALTKSGNDENILKILGTEKIMESNRNKAGPMAALITILLGYMLSIARFLNYSVHNSMATLGHPLHP
jgi:hypothetical protein